MNNMIRLKDKVINKDHIFYIEEMVEIKDLMIISSCLDRYIISYDSKEELLEDVNKLRKIGFKEIEYHLFNLDNVTCIEFYKDKVKGEEKDFAQVMFCNNASQPLSFELKGLISELDEPGDILDDIMLDSKY